jgi:sulfur carrier protein
MEKIEVRLFATFRLNRGRLVIVQVEEPATPLKAIQKLGIEKEEVAILLINGIAGPVDEIITESDYLSIFPPVGGG